MYPEEGSEQTRRQFLRAALCSVGGLLSGCAFGGDTSAHVEHPLPTGTPAAARPTERATATTTPTRTISTTKTDGAVAGNQGFPSLESRLPQMAQEYDTALNVLDAGVDPEAGAPIGETLDSLVGEEALLFFPEGRYRMDGHWDLSRVKRLAVVGDGATIVPEDGYDETLFYIGEESEAASAHIENVTFDFSAPATGARPLNIRVRDRLLVENVTVKGSTRSVRFDVTNPEGRGVVRGLEMPDGGLPGEHAVGCLVGPENRGEMVFEDCTISGFPNNGLYASPSEGPVTVRGGTFRNNGIANVRVSGPSTVSGVTVECDRAPDGFENMRGIWLRGGECTVEDCEVHMSEVTFSEGGIVGAIAGEIRDCWVHVDADDVTAVSIKPPRGESTWGGNGVRCTGLDVTGSAGKNAAILVTDRNGCHFESLTVRQSGPGRHGLRFIRSDNSVVRDATVEVTGAPLWFEDSRVETEDVRATRLPPEGVRSGGGATNQ